MTKGQGTMQKQGYLWINQKGMYLVINEYSTHCGTRIEFSFVSDINQATVLPFIDRKYRAQFENYKGTLIKVPALLSVVRNVTLRSED